MTAFLSYSHSDKETIKLVVEGLSKEGIKVFYDEHISPSGKISQTIRQQIKDCSHFVVFLSKEAIASEWVQVEIDAAFQASRHVIPVHLDALDTNAAEYPALLLNIKRIDGSDPQALVKDLSRVIQSLPPVEATSNQQAGLLSFVASVIVSGIVSILLIAITVTLIFEFGGAIICPDPSPSAHRDLPVGTVITSMFNQTNFRKFAGENWVLADGRNVVGSVWAIETGQDRVPNLCGMFLRGIDVGATGRDPDGERPAGHLQQSALRTHSHPITKITFGRGQSDQKAQPGSGPINVAPKDKKEELPALAEGKMPDEPEVTETRPSNVAVYYYIRVN